MTYQLECLYCGQTWELSWIPREPECGACKDKNIKVKKHTKGNFFGYEEDDNKETHDLNETIRWGSD